MKHQINNFLAGLVTYDYIFFAAVALLFILLLVLAVVLRNRLTLAVLIILFAFIELILGSTLGYKSMHAYLYKAELEVTEFKALEFTDALVLKGTLTNASKLPFTHCDVTAGAYKVSGNSLLDMLYPLNPFAKASIVVKQDLAVGESVDYKIIIEPFTYSNEYNITTGVRCR